MASAAENNEELRGISGVTGAADPVDSFRSFRIGRYELFDRIAAGGMATVYFGRVVGGAGFRRTVALKRLHPHLAQERSFVAMLRDEARLAGRIRHRSVVPVLDVVEAEGELLLVLELVEGPPLSKLLQKLREAGTPMPLPIASGIVRGILSGLGAAHSATDESGAPLELVHRDVSAQNILLGVDGIPRVVDFGIAKARGRMQTTDDGRLKGNFAYMAPEQARRQPISARADLYTAGVILWECLTGRGMHADEDAATILTKLLYDEPAPVSDFRDVPPEVDALVKKALQRNPDDRFESASAMSEAIGKTLGTAGPEDVTNFLREHMPQELDELRARIERVERAPAADDSGANYRASFPSLSDTGGGRLLQRNSEPPGGNRVTAVVNSVTIPPEGPRRRRRRMLPIGALALLLIGGGAFATRSRWLPSPPQQAAPVAAAAAPAPKPVEKIEPTPPAAAAPVPAPVVSAAPETKVEPAPAASVSSAVVPPKRGKPPVRKPAAKPAAEPAGAAPPPAEPSPPVGTGLQGIPGVR